MHCGTPAIAEEQRAALDQAQPTDGARHSIDPSGRNAIDHDDRVLAILGDVIPGFNTLASWGGGGGARKRVPRRP